MGSVSYFLGVFGAALMLLVVVEMLRRGKLRERHAIWWLIFGLINLILALFPKLLEALTRLVGIELPINLVFFVGIIVLFLVNIQQASELTKFESANRTLAEELALLENRVRELEKDKN